MAPPELREFMVWSEDAGLPREGAVTYSAISAYGAAVGFVEEYCNPRKEWSDFAYGSAPGWNVFVRQSNGSVVQYRVYYELRATEVQDAS